MSDDRNQASLPPFYRKPEVLSSKLHGAWRIRDHGQGFAANAAFVSLSVGEISAASRDYPVLFAKDSGAPLALLGLDQENLFVEADGRWTEGAYVPAYVRRYPFALHRVGEDFVLIVDAAADSVVTQGDEGNALFEAGEPTAYTGNVLELCRTMQIDSGATEAFSQALRDQDLLVERRADYTSPQGNRLGVAGFCVIDVERFANLDGTVLAEWHRNNWLGLVHFHLASLDRFRSLMDRQLLCESKRERDAA